MPDLDHFREILSQFSAASVLDVALIAAAIIGGLRLLSGTRAMTQLRGALFFVAAAVVLGRLFDLTAVNYLVDNSAQILVIAAIVVFQPEIRRALDRLGRTGLTGWSAEPNLRAAIDAVARAAADMSAHHHGGLIVLERETGLQDIIESGVPVDARVSAELLENIFFPNSPLHDMAVVLRDDRVIAAGCVLPLAATATDGDRFLGTRHRAALGITEQTDAVSVVVSEETGEISVALGGRLTPVADDRRLRTVLQWLLEPVPATGFARGRGGDAPV